MIYERGLICSKLILNNEGLSKLPIKIQAAFGLKYPLLLKEDHHQTIKDECLIIEKPPIEDAIFNLAALNYVIKKAIPIRGTTLDPNSLSEVLRSIPAALKRWPWEEKPKTKTSSIQKWDVMNEYHVQSLVWTILRPIFHDLKDEEYLKSIGYKHPRVDLAIPSLRIIIEIKYLRTSNQSALSDITEEVAADTALYLKQGKDYDAIIAFIWDHLGAVQHHATLESGIKSLNGIKDAIVVSRPGDWV